MKQNKTRALPATLKRKKKNPWLSYSSTVGTNRGNNSTIVLSCFPDDQPCILYACQSCSANIHAVVCSVNFRADLKTPPTWNCTSAQPNFTKVGGVVPGSAEASLCSTLGVIPHSMTPSKIGIVVLCKSTAMHVMGMHINHSIAGLNRASGFPQKSGCASWQ